MCFRRQNRLELNTMKESALSPAKKVAKIGLHMRIAEYTGGEDLARPTVGVAR